MRQAHVVEQVECRLPAFGVFTPKHTPLLGLAVNLQLNGKFDERVVRVDVRRAARNGESHHVARLVLVAKCVPLTHDAAGGDRQAWCHAVRQTVHVNQRADSGVFLFTCHRTRTGTLHAAGLVEAFCR